MSDLVRNNKDRVTLTRVGRFRWDTTLHRKGDLEWIAFEGPHFLSRARAERWALRWIAEQERMREWETAATQVEAP